MHNKINSFIYQKVMRVYNLHQKYTFNTFIKAACDILLNFSWQDENISSFHCSNKYVRMKTKMKFK